VQVYTLVIAKCLGGSLFVDKVYDVSFVLRNILWTSAMTTRSLNAFSNFVVVKCKFSLVCTLWGKCAKVHFIIPSGYLENYKNIMQLLFAFYSYSYSYFTFLYILIYARLACPAWCIIAVVTARIMFACTGESTFEVKFEADSNYITEHPHDNKPRPYLCTVCDKRFPTKGQLNVHKQIHTTDKLYSCTQCEKQFTTQYYVKSHMNVHSSKYKCTECGKCFSSNQALTAHRRSHSGEKPFECTVCSKRFTQSNELVIHGRTHSGEKPFKCLECDKAFSQSTHLNRHMRVHTGDKPYKCSLCKKSFTSSSDLLRHKCRVHSNRRPYDCRYCGKLFKSSDDLKLHVRTHTDVSCTHVHIILFNRKHCEAKHGTCVTCLLTQRHCSLVSDLTAASLTWLKKCCYRDTFWDVAFFVLSKKLYMFFTWFLHKFWFLKL